MYISIHGRSRKKKVKQSSAKSRYRFRTLINFERTFERHQCPSFLSEWAALQQARAVFLSAADLSAELERCSQAEQPEQRFRAPLPLRGGLEQPFRVPLRLRGVLGQPFRESMRLRGGFGQPFRVPQQLRGGLEQPFRAICGSRPGSSGHMQQRAAFLEATKAPRTLKRTRSPRRGANFMNRYTYLISIIGFV